MLVAFQAGFGCSSSKLPIPASRFVWGGFRGKHSAFLALINCPERFDDRSSRLYQLEKVRIANMGRDSASPHAVVGRALSGCGRVCGRAGIVQGSYLHLKDLGQETVLQIKSLRYYDKASKGNINDEPYCPPMSTSAVRTIYSVDSTSGNHVKLSTPGSTCRPGPVLSCVLARLLRARRLPLRDNQASHSHALSDTVYWIVQVPN